MVPVETPKPREIVGKKGNTKRYAILEINLPNVIRISPAGNSAENLLTFDLVPSFIPTKRWYEMMCQPPQKTP